MSNYRRGTRDLLLEYDAAIMPPKPRAAGLGTVYPWDVLIDNTDDLMPPQPHAARINMVYPWENTALSILYKQLYIIAVHYGFTGTEDDFANNFFTYVGEKQIIFALFNDFPQVGSTEKLYFDLEEKILYYWDNDYIPVNAMLIANTKLDGGEA